MNLPGLLTSVSVRRASRRLCALVVAALCLAGYTTAALAETSVVIESCSVFDPESGKMLPEQTIVVRGARIVSVTGEDEPGDVPADAQRIDGRGTTVGQAQGDRHQHADTSAS